MGFIIFLIIVVVIIIVVKSSNNTSNNNSEQRTLNYSVTDDSPYVPQPKPEVIYDKTALRCEKGQGLIGYYGLEDWFNKTFSEEETSYIKEKLAKTMMNPDQLNKGTFSETNQPAYKFLSSIAYNFKTKVDLSYAIKFLKKSDELADLSEMTATDIHYFCMDRIEIYYKDRDNPDSLDKTIYWCKKMIEVAPQAYKEIREEEKNMYTAEDRRTLPKELLNATATAKHKGFEQLAVIEFKRGNYEEVIRVCELAKKSKFGGDWDNKIEQAKKKLEGKK